jgi:enoyl-CoA hydratase
MEMWEDLYNVFNGIKHDEKVKVVILNGSNNNFSTGMDLEVFAEMSKLSSLVKCEGRKREGIENLIIFFQDCISAPEITCPVPVIAAISGYCIGGAVDLIAACDMRYCTNSSNFSIKETDLAMVADIGTLQRLPKLIGDSQTRELAYTSRIFNGTEAEKLGLALKSFNTDEELMSHVHKLAESIALKSPLTIRGIKKTLLYSRDHTVNDSLYQVNLHNTAYLYNADLMEATKAHLTKSKPSFTLP